MKTITRFFLVVLVVLSALITKAAFGKEVSPIASKHKNLFVFKADKKFIGATVEVFYSNGDLVTSQTLENRKMIIDFCDAKFGEYTIRVVKGDKKQEFHYVKK